MLSHRVLRSVWAGFSLLLACDSGQLPAPVYSVISGNGLCSFWRAVDAQRRRWSDSGCEGSSTGLRAEGEISEAEFARLEAAFSTLPPPKQTACDPPDAGAPQTPPSALEIGLERWTPEELKQWGHCQLQSSAFAPYASQLSSILTIVQNPRAPVAY